MILIEIFENLDFWSKFFENVDFKVRSHMHGSGRGRKIGFNTNHYIWSHIRGRWEEAEQEQNPLHNKWLQHLIFHVRFETARFKPSLSTRNGRSTRPLRACMNIPMVTEQEYWNSPISAPHPHAHMWM